MSLSQVARSKMRFPHYRRKRVLACIVLGGVLLLTVNYILKSEDTNGCGRTAQTEPCLRSLFPQVVNSLNSLGLSNYLCYYSLWGSLKYGRPLPWINKVELCLRNEEVAELDEGHLLKTFRRQGVAAYYDAANGLYRATLLEGDNSICEVYLYVFEEDPITHMIRRVGWKNRLVPPGNCDTLHCFPKALIDPPLLDVNFLGAKVDVPHDGIELQKYLFPDSWWKELVPPKCK